MHVLVATDGCLDLEPTAAMATALAGSEGKITIITIVEVPRRFLTELRGSHAQTEAISLDREDVSVLAADVREKDNWPGDDAVIQRYLDDKRDERTSSLVEAVRRAGIDPEVVAKEGEHVAKELLVAIGDLGADVVVVGSHGIGFFDGLLGSTGTKLARQAPCPVLLLRNA